MARRESDGKNASRTCEDCPSRQVPVERCESCKELKAEYGRAFRAKQAKAGRCQDCARKAIRGQLLCAEHQAAATERSRVHHAEHREIANEAMRTLRHARREAGLCAGCGRRSKARYLCSACVPTSTTSAAAP